MRKLLLIIFVTLLVLYPVKATAMEPPDPPAGVEKYLPEESNSFTKDLLYILKVALTDLAPEISEAMRLCAAVIALQLLMAMVSGFSGIAQKTVSLAGVVALSILLLSPSKALIAMGMETISTINEYNKLLLPVLTAALASQGGLTTSTALYSGTVVLDNILTILMTKVMTPLLYAYIVVGISCVAIEEKILKQLLGFLKWLMTWTLKITAYVFTGYMGVTGVICGTVDASTIKATKLTISGTVPIIGNIISDASEAVLVGVGVVKNSIGVYGALVTVAIWLSPFLAVGVQYLLLKITAGISSLIGEAKTTAVALHFSSSMGYVMAMLGVTCILQLISIVCFLKGVRA